MAEKRRRLSEAWYASQMFYVLNVILEAVLVIVLYKAYAEN